MDKRKQLVLEIQEHVEQVLKEYDDSFKIWEEGGDHRGNKKIYESNRFMIDSSTLFDTWGYRWLHLKWAGAITTFLTVSVRSDDGDFVVFSDKGEFDVSYRFVIYLNGMESETIKDKDVMMDKVEKILVGEVDRKMAEREENNRAFRELQDN